MEFRHVFGPVLSRRLGRSLGIDPVPFKTCNWNCVYCQLGRTSPLINERKEFVPADRVLEEVSQALQLHGESAIDWITFLGAGEPALHARLGFMIRRIKELTRIPVAVITNGSLLYQAGMREELMAADAVMPSLDAGTARLFKKINRPHPHATFQHLIEGLSVFSREYRGRLWIEVMLVHGLNDTGEALRDLAAVLDRIAPGEIHVNSPVRPPAEPWVKAPPPEVLTRAASLLGSAARRIPSQIATMDLSGVEDVVGAILAVISRHPMTEEELQITLHRWKPGDIGRALRRLAASGRAQVVTRNGRRFWTGAEARYGATA